MHTPWQYVGRSLCAGRHRSSSLPVWWHSGGDPERLWASALPFVRPLGEQSFMLGFLNMSSCLSVPWLVVAVCTHAERHGLLQQIPLLSHNTFPLSWGPRYDMGINFKLMWFLLTITINTNFRLLVPRAQLLSCWYLIDREIWTTEELSKCNKCCLLLGFSVSTR